MEFVSIIMGSKSDYEVMSECAKVLEKFGVPYEFIISSAHRSPERTKNYVLDAQSRGAEVFIAAAGMAAHLAGAIAAQTCKPVIGVPLTSTQSAINGLDSLLATVQMPSGMPVATMAIGKAGAINAAHLAIQILSIKDNNLAKKLSDERESKLKDLELSSQEIQVLLRG